MDNNKIEAGKLKHGRYMIYLQLGILSIVGIFTSYILDKIPIGLIPFSFLIFSTVIGVFVLYSDLKCSELEDEIGWAESDDVNDVEQENKGGSD